MKKSMKERFLKSTYLSKGTDLSATDFVRPKYQLWVSKHFEVPSSEEVGFKSAIGSAWHKACEVEPEVGVVKEFSFIKEVNGKTVGGTADLLEWNDEKKIWQIGDHKTKGVYPAKAFLGIGTKAKPNPPKQQDKEIMQLSIYRYLFSEMYNIDDTAIIYLWVIGHSGRDKAQGVPEYDEIEIQLLPIENVKTYMDKTIDIAYSDTEPTKDCEDWLCDYCEYKDVCPFLKNKKSSGFTDLS